METTNARASEGEQLPVDLETIGVTVANALAIRLSMPERPQIDATTRTLIGHLGELLLEDLGFDEDPDVRAMYQQAYRLLELSRRPTRQATQFGAYEYMREVARLTRRFASVYRELNEEASTATP